MRVAVGGVGAGSTGVLAGAAAGEAASRGVAVPFIAHIVIHDEVIA